MSDNKLSKKCENCGKTKTVDKNFTPCKFNNDLLEIWCKECKTKEILTKQDFINYLTMNNTCFNETNWEHSFVWCKERELKKYSNHKDLPMDFDLKVTKGTIGKYYAQSNITGKYEPYANTNKNIKHLNEKQEEIKEYSKDWMGHYIQSEIDYLEDYLKGLHNDFKIVTTNHKDYAKKIAKASLHMDKCYEDLLNGVPGADAKYKTSRENFDTMSKSAQFAESGRGQNDVSLGCFGVTFDKVEKKMWIPKHIPIEQDQFDKMISQFDSINESL